MITINNKENLARVGTFPNGTFFNHSGKTYLKLRYTAKDGAWVVEAFDFGENQVMILQPTEKVKCLDVKMQIQDDLGLRIGEVPIGTFFKTVEGTFIRLGHSTTRNDVIEALNLINNAIEYFDDIVRVQVYDAEINLTLVQKEANRSSRHLVNEEGE